MFSIPGVLGLIFLTYVRPQAFLLELRGVPLLHFVYLLAVIGFAIDLRTRLISPRTAPLLWLSIGYFIWSILTIARVRPGLVSPIVGAMAIRFALFFMVAQAVQSFRTLRTAVLTLVLVSIFLSVVGIDQGLAPRGCFAFGSSPTAVFDGRPCETHAECMHEGDPNVRYTCEKIGLFGTYTVNGRVRWLGIIEDPNELAMCVSLCVPLLIGLYLLRPSARSALFLVVAGSAFVWCTVFTQSRGGQLVFLTALAIYFVRRYGVRGAIVVGVMAAPVLLFGGRSGTEAEESKMERLEALYVASQLIVRKPLFGVGFSQFEEYHIRTAHNSYALAGAEMGLIGLALFIAVFYQSMKAFVVSTRRYDAHGPSRPAYVWAGSLMAAQGGLMAGVFFLSFNSSPILWTFMGVCGGFQLAVRRHDPAADFGLHRRDWLNIVGITLGLTAFMYGYSHWKANAP
jgi:O-antigen ligase